MDKDFSFHSRGKESFAFLLHFPSFLKLLIDNTERCDVIQLLYQLFLQFYYLQHIVLLMTRIESFGDASLNSLNDHCQLLFKLSVIFDLGKPTPSF